MNAFVNRFTGPERTLTLGLAIAGLLVVITSLGAGPLSLSPAEVFRALMSPLADSVTGDTAATIQATTLWDVRLPRIVMAMLVGAVLAVCGAILQGLFGNPLADPGILGISTGASLGSLLAVILGIATLGRWTLPMGAFLGALGITALIYRLARPDGAAAGNVRLLLVGIAANAAVSSAIGWLSYFATAEQRQQLSFFSFGTLSTTNWGVVGLVLPLAILGIGILMRYAAQLDLLALGEKQAAHMGVDVPKLRIILIVVTAVLVAAGVAFAGQIAFVGLIIPHLCRLVIGPGHRALIPLSAAAGAFLLLTADLISRTAVSPAEMPIGILTGTIGGPFFLWLVWRDARLR